MSMVTFVDLLLSIPYLEHMTQNHYFKNRRPVLGAPYR